MQFSFFFRGPGEGDYIWILPEKRFIRSGKGCRGCRRWKRCLNFDDWMPWHFQNSMTLRRNKNVEMRVPFVFATLSSPGNRTFRIIGNLWTSAPFELSLLPARDQFKQCDCLWYLHKHIFTTVRIRGNSLFIESNKLLPQLSRST